MLIRLSFILYTLQLTPLFLLVRAVILATRPDLYRRTVPLHELGIIVFWLYLSCVCYITINFVRILHGQFEMGHNYNIKPFAEITSIASSGDTVYALCNIAGNVVMFVPLGFLLPLMWRGWQAGRTFLISVFLSGSIEVLQLFTGRGADIDDVILNALGAVIGYLLHHILRAACPGITARFRLSDEGNRPGRRTAKSIATIDCSRQDRPKKMIPQSHRIPPPDIHHTNHRKRFRWIALTMTVVTLCASVSGAVLLSGSHGHSIRTGHGPVAVFPRPVTETMPGAALGMPAVNSANILLACADMSQVLYEQNARQRIYPASLTKIMTTILFLESVGDIEEVIALRGDIFSGIYEANLSTAGFQPGEEARAIDLVYGVMLPSGAECAVALAEHIAGSEAAYVTLMNVKALQLGMIDTHFVNVTGSHHRDHYTTAQDMARLLSYAIKNPMFRSIVSTGHHSTAPTNLHPAGITFESTLFGRAGQATFPGGVLLGGKTGYTDEAGQCLASFSQIGEQEYILVTAGAVPVDFRIEQLHIEDAFAIYSALGDMDTQAWYNKDTQFEEGVAPWRISLWWTMKGK